jgi:hypothetical protein
VRGGSSIKLPRYNVVFSQMLAYSQDLSRGQIAIRIEKAMYRQFRQPKRMREQEGRGFAPLFTALLHAAPRTSGGFHSHFSTGQCPFIPSLRLSGGWRPVILTVRVLALLFNAIRYSVQS